MVLCPRQPEAHSGGGSRVCVLTAGRVGLPARLEGAGEPREAVDETDHHPVDVHPPGAAQGDAQEEVPLRVVSDPQAA